MKYAKIPLDERLGRLSGFQRTNWAYAPMLRDWAETPIASYLGEGSRYRSWHHGGRGKCHDIRRGNGAHRHVV